MKIIADENIPYVHQLFGPLGDVRAMPGRGIRPEDVEDADVLLVRSVTPVNEALLGNSAVKFVGTCTIGVDHLNVEYLNQNNIVYASAPGCNANAVVQYVVSALTQLKRNPSESPNVVVIGGGNVGSRVYAALSALGFRCSCVDPFLDPNKSDMQLVPLEEIYKADIVCCHTPLTRQGPHPTWHMLSEQELRNLRPGTLLLNAGRGAVINNKALLDVLNSGVEIDTVLDVWEAEPNIDIALLNKVNLGTPHIAGYSFEGRLTGSVMIFDALCRFLGRDESQVKNQVVSEAMGAQRKLDTSNLEEAIAQVYAIHHDFEQLVAAVSGLPESFDMLRKHYPQRREYTHFVLPENIQNKQQLLALGFSSE